MIRPTTCLDTPNILNLTKEFYQQTSYNNWAQFDPDSVTDIINALRTRGILLVAEEEGELIGIVGVMIMPFMFNTFFNVGHEVIWYVKDSHRKTSVGIELLKRADSMCALRGWKAFQMMRLEESSPKLDGLFTGLGFRPTERGFTKVY